MVRPVNAEALAIANSSEGCVLYPYDDATGRKVTHVGQSIKGRLTAGRGHTGPDVVPGMIVTQAQADAWFVADIQKAASFIEAHVKVPLTDNQFSALAEWTFNVGTGAFLGSTLLKKLNKKQYDAVPQELAKWVNGINPRTGRKGPLPGLVSRRRKEADLWSKSEWIPHTEILASASFSTLEPSPLSKPSPPTLLERVRAWFYGGAQVPS